MGALVLAWLLTLVASAGAASMAPSVTLRPALARGTAQVGVRVGPFGLHNGTEASFRLRTFPVLLGQARDGGLLVRLDPRSLASARTLMSVTESSSAFPAGGDAIASAKVRKLPTQHGLYGGVLFEAVPQAVAGRREPQVKDLLRVDARVLLDPPVAFRRTLFSAERPLLEQVGSHHLGMDLPITNRGNVFASVPGTWRIRSASGAIVAHGSLPKIRVLPGATVELKRSVDAALPAGDYRLSAALHYGGHHLRVEGNAQLVGVSEVISRTARLQAFVPGHVYAGHTDELTATFQNTGNVRFAPQVQILLAPALGARAGQVAESARATVQQVAAGQTGTIRAAVEIPPSTRPLQLTARLMHDGHTLDERTASVTPIRRPGLLDRIESFLSEHSIAALVAMLVLLLASVAFAVAYVRRLKTQLGRPTPSV